MILSNDKSEGPPSARRFVTLRASANNVMRKLGVYDPFASLGLEGYGGCENA